MSGIRLKHRELHSCIFAVTTLRPYPTPYHCLTCKVTHNRKTYHLNLDDQGACIVSETVLEALRPFMADAGLEQGNSVKKPPTLQIGGPATGPARIYARDSVSGEYRDIERVQIT